MQFNPENNVVKLCVQGMEAEAAGNSEEAYRLFETAWNTATNDLESFTAAHYLARKQHDPHKELYWNKISLSKALNIDDKSVKSFLPSLYLNIAKCHETLQETNDAKNNYELAAGFYEHLADDQYGKMIKTGINEGLKRMGSGTFANDTLDALINAWCERKHLKPLSIILPFYLSKQETTHDLNQLISALRLLNATQCLPANEQQKTTLLYNHLSAKNLSEQN